MNWGTETKESQAKHPKHVILGSEGLERSNGVAF